MLSGHFISISHGVSKSPFVSSFSLGVSKSCFGLVMFYPASLKGSSGVCSTLPGLWFTVRLCLAVIRGISALASNQAPMEGMSGVLVGSKWFSVVCFGASAMKC